MGRTRDVSRIITTPPDIYATDSEVILKEIVDAKGDLLVGTADNTVGRLGVTGPTGSVLVTDAGETTGLKWEAKTEILKLIYPIGSIYINATDSTNPGTLLGFGTWSAFGAGRVPVGFNSSDSDFNSAEKTGGAKTHTLTTSEMPSHFHTIDTFLGVNVGGAPDLVQVYGTGGGGSNSSRSTNSTGGGGAHNNLQPYITVYMWKRTA